TIARLSPRNHCSQTNPNVSPKNARLPAPMVADATGDKSAAMRTKPAKSRSVFNQGGSGRKRRSRDAESSALMQSLAYDDQSSHGGADPRVNKRTGSAARTYHHQRSGRSKRSAIRSTASGGQSAAPAPVAHLPPHRHAAE